MSSPLLMLGPGGSYNTRYDVKGKTLVKSRTAASQGHDPEGESAGGLAAWAQLRGRGADGDNADAPPRRRPADRFEHHDPSATPTYAEPGKAGVQQKLALLHALTHWMQVQGQQLDDLDDRHEKLVSSVDAAAAPQPAVRLIRWNGGTLDLPTPAPVFAGRTNAGDPLDPQALAQTDTDTPPTFAFTRPPHDHPKPHPKADEDPLHDPRVPAEPWLFADHAGAGRRTGRLQSHRLRTRRSTHQKGLPHPRPEQGALFGVVA